MFKAIITNAVVSKGYDGAAPFRYSENKNAVQFKIGYRVYDKNAKDNQRYINLAVKAFGGLCERIEKMQLKESSHINIIGRMDEERWEDNGQQHSRFIIIAEEIEYSGSGTKPNGNGNGTGDAGSAPQTQNGQGQPPAPPQSQQAAPQGHPPQNPQNGSGMPSNFTGYENYGEENPFFPTGN